MGCGLYCSPSHGSTSTSEPSTASSHISIRARAEAKPIFLYASLTLRNPDKKCHLGLWMINVLGINTCPQPLLKVSEWSIPQGKARAILRKRISQMIESHFKHPKMEECDLKISQNNDRSRHKLTFTGEKEPQAMSAIGCFKGSLTSFIFLLGNT